MNNLNPIFLSLIEYRAILGSVERMIAVLTENFGGKWPFWLSPRQTMVVPVGPTLNQYAQEVRDRLKSNGYCADVDTDDGNSFNKKVRNAQLAQYNFIFGKLYVNDKLNKMLNTPICTCTDITRYSRTIKFFYFSCWRKRKR